MLFANLTNALSGTLQTALGETVAYKRAANPSFEISAIQASSEHQVPNDHGVLMAVTSKDFLIPADALSDAGINKPRRGDTITVNGKTFEVAPISDGKAVYDFSDHQSTQYRIHTKEAN